MRFDPLALIPQFSDEAVPRLASPPVWEAWFFERPWGAAVGLLVAGVIALWLLRRTGKRREGTIAFGVALLIAGAMVITASLVETTREVLRDKTRRLIGAAARAEIDVLAELLATDAVVMLNGQSYVSEEAAILDEVRKTTGSRYPVKEIAVLEERQQMEGRNVGYAQVRVRAVPQDFNMPVRSWWRVAWRREDDGQGGTTWQATSMDMLQIDLAGDPNDLRNGM